MEIFETIYSSELEFLCFSLRLCFLSECDPAPDVFACFATKFRGVGATGFFFAFASNNSKSLIAAPLKIMEEHSSELCSSDACFFGSSHNGPKAVVSIIYQKENYL